MPIHPGTAEAVQEVAWPATDRDETKSILEGRRVDVILNAAAGTLRKRGPSAAARTIADTLEDVGASCVVHACSPRQVRARIATVARNPFVDVVIVGGGDGTISTAAHLLAHSGKPLGVLPLGTMNLLARDLDMPLGLDAAVRALCTGAFREIDLGEVNGRKFALNAILGLYPWVIRRRDQEPIQSRAGKIAAWFKVAPRALTAAPTLSATLEHEGQKTEIRTHLLMIAAGPTNGGVGPLLRRETLDAGKLFVYYEKRATQAALLKLMAAAAVGPWPASSEVDCFECPTVTIRSRRRKLPVSVDGEVLLLRTPLKFRTLPRALSVIVPQARVSESDNVSTSR